jgi:glycosyltransferase involved in cell wall biosynthesis
VSGRPGARSTDAAGAGGPPYVIVTGDFVRTGGMDVANFALASYLARAGRRLHLVAYRVDDELAAHRDVVVHRVPKPLGAYTLGSPLLAAAGAAQAARMARRGGRIVVNGGNCVAPGVNWVHYVHAAFEPVGAAGGWRSAKARATHALNKLTERAALHAAKLVLTNSDRTRRDVIERIGVAGDRVRTVYFGVDADRFHPAAAGERLAVRRSLGWSEGRAAVAFIGALTDRRKGFDVAYDAWRQLCSRPSWDADLVVIGQGAELDVWRGRAARDGVGDRVRFLGFRSDVPRVLSACDALVAPARYEAYGVGVHEALCCALPALVSASAGIAERYPPALHDLLLEDAESAAAVAAALWRWRERASEVGAALLPFAEQLRQRSWDDMARDIVSLCDERG